MTRMITYGEAINDALSVMLKHDERVFVIGVGVNSPWYMGMSTKDLDKRFGNERVIDIPISENGITGMCVGAALAGMKPVVNHPRMDFMYYAFDPIINHASTAHYMFGGKVNAPITIRAVINRGGEQSTQHSQSIHSMFAHVPGLKVVMPSTPYDAKGLLISSINDGNPVLYIDDRWLYDIQGDVPEGIYNVPIGKGIVRHHGSDLTIVATSYVCSLATKVAEELSKEGLSIEVIDPRTIKPLDKNLIVESVKKTKRLLVIDAGWSFCGFAAEVISEISEDEELFGIMKHFPVRLTLPDCHAPASRTLEKEYYIDKDKIKDKIFKILNKAKIR
jgi:pyruvate dehydrogenase E1 component beta subunit